MLRSVNSDLPCAAEGCLEHIIVTELHVESCSLGTFMLIAFYVSYRGRRGGLRDEAEDG